MKESIHIQNLGPIRNIFLEEIQPITVLIGESGSGKSTLMKVLALFRWLFKMHNIRSYLKRSQVSKSPFRYRIESFWENCGLSDYLSDQTEVVYTVWLESGNHYRLEYKGGKLTGTSDKELVAEEDLHFLKLSFISEYRNIIPLWADRGAALAGGYLGYYFHEVFGDFDLASNNIKDFDIPYLGLTLSVRKSQSAKRFFISPKGEAGFEIQLKHSSSGTQNAIPITLIAEHFASHFKFEDAFNRSVLDLVRNSDSLTDFKPIKNLGDMRKKIFLHIEEPELSLFPDAQCELIGDLLRKSFVTNQNDVELIFSTHSPYIVNYLNLLIKAGDEGKLVDGTSIRFEDLGVFQIEVGEIVKLNLSKERIIDTNPLSDTINDIYNRFLRL